METSPGEVRAIQSLIVQGNSLAAIRSLLIDRGAQPEQAEKQIAEAQLLLCQAANVDPIVEYGAAITRLTTLYKATSAAKDHRTALAIQKEINRLLGLYKETVDGGARDPASESALAEIEAVKTHLLPLELLPAELPVSEHARIAAAMIVQHRSGAGRDGAG